MVEKLDVRLNLFSFSVRPCDEYNSAFELLFERHQQKGACAAREAGHDRSTGQRACSAAGPSHSLSQPIHLIGLKQPFENLVSVASGADRGVYSHLKRAGKPAGSGPDINCNKLERADAKHPKNAVPT